MVVSILRQCSKGAVCLMGSIISSQGWYNKDRGPVKVAHSRNFKTIVTDSGKEALILFYSPMCRHCQAIAPVWEELGDKLQNEDVDIVKIDASANEWPFSVYTLDGVPTIYWKYAEQSQKPVKYHGGRGLEDLIAYVSKNATKELSGWDRKGRPK